MQWAGHASRHRRAPHGAIVASGSRCTLGSHAFATRDACLLTEPCSGCRFANNPLVSNSQNPIRFYAGAPLIASNGKRLGAL